MTEPEKNPSSTDLQTEEFGFVDTEQADAMEEAAAQALPRGAYARALALATGIAEDNSDG